MEDMDSVIKPRPPSIKQKKPRPKSMHRDIVESPKPLAHTHTGTTAIQLNLQWKLYISDKEMHGYEIPTLKFCCICAGTTLPCCMEVYKLNTNNLKYLQEVKD